MNVHAMLAVNHFAAFEVDEQIVDRRAVQYFLQMDLRIVDGDKRII